MSNYLTTDWLNMRLTPQISNNIMGVLPPGTILEQLPEGSIDNWVHVKGFLNKRPATGYTSSLYLETTDEPLPIPDQLTSVPAVNLSSGNKLIKRADSSGRAFPLNEPGIIRQDLKSIADGPARIELIHSIIQWLNVEQSARYAPNSKNTFCNIYAFDVCHCLGTFIPRVWWTADAYNKILSGITPKIIYDNTVTELNANSLCNWFENYGHMFGWSPAFDVNTFQQQVNLGTIGIIVARRINLNRSGHIVAVVPELPDQTAKREGDSVVSPLQSQAGSVNKQFFTGSNWWLNPNKFSKFGLWLYQSPT